jgi:hypothetical protein
MAGQRFNRKAISIIAAFTVLMMVGLLVANLVSVDFGGAGDSILPYIQGYVQGLTLVLLLAFGAFIVYVLFFLQGRAKVEGKTERGGSGSTFIKIMAYAIVAVLVIMLLALIHPADPINIAPEENSPVNNGTAGTDQTGNNGLSVQGTTIILLIAIIVVAIVVLALIRRRGNNKIIYTSRMANLQAQAVIEEAVRKLHAGEDVRSVIIRAYQEMEMLLPRGRFGDDRLLTPREFASRAVAELRWPQSQVTELTALFEEARYSDHPVAESQKERAIRCLNGIQESLGGDPHGRPTA